ncbi:MAG: sodium/solute symporter [Armatimonadia bacterium]|nr:sodium/solute symporter [Armatimonadia bacterium]
MGEVALLPLIAAIAVLALTMYLGLSAARRTATLDDYWVAGRGVDVFTNASAISSNYLSAASFLGVPAFVWANGFDGVWYATGFAAGYILLLLFIASPLRRFGEYTIPDFCAGRFNSARLRRAGIAWTMVISALYIIAQMVGVGTVMEVVLNIEFMWGVIILGSIITLYVAFGGMTGVTMAQMAQFWIMLTAMILPLVVLMPRYDYSELLMHAYRSTAQVSTQADQASTVEGTPAFTEDEQQKFDSLLDWVKPFNKWGLFGSVSLLVALVCGTAGLPHILARFYTNPNAKAARWSTVWVLIFIGVFYITTPIWGTYARAVLGPDAVEINAANEVNNNTMMLLTSREAGAWAEALVTAGAVAALLSTVSGLLIALSSAIAHDFYGEIFRPDASDTQKMRVAKIAAVICGAFGILVGLAFREVNIAWMVGLAFAVAASTFFPLLMMGIWWRKVTEQGAFWGLIVGGGLSAGVVIGHLAGWWPYDQPAIVTVPLAFLTIYVVSKMTQDQPEEGWEQLETSFHALHHPDSDLPHLESEMDVATEPAATAEMPHDEPVETIEHRGDSEGES